MADRLSLRAAVLAILTSSAGLSPENVADAIVTAVCGPVTETDIPPSAPLDPADPAVTGVPRDETHDGIDAGTGVLTDEATQRRAELQAAADSADAKVAADEAALATDKAADADAHAALDADATGEAETTLSAEAAPHSDPADPLS